MTNNHQDQASAGNSTVILSDIQTQKIGEAVELSVSKWKDARISSGQTLSDTEVQNYLDFVTERITKSVISGSQRSAIELAKGAKIKAAKKERNARIHEMYGIADEHGVEFHIKREVDLVSIGGPTWDNKKCTYTGKYKQVQRNQGGIVICSRPWTAGLLVGCELSMAICRSDENFDLTQGLDLALGRFLNGETVVIFSDMVDRKLVASDFNNDDILDAADYYIREIEAGFPDSTVKVA